jgi:light-regulated signal transduction histidine kinase (bacteriophytochrome)
VREAELKLREYQEQLEGLVSERTHDLSLANRELEAFVSSVSHDLRAPLRGIDGLLKLLEEREGARVSPAGRELISRVQAGARRMGTIIADLLQLARVTRTKLRRERLDLTWLAHAVAADLDRDGVRGPGARAAGPREPPGQCVEVHRPQRSRRHRVGERGAGGLAFPVLRAR